MDSGNAVSPASVGAIEANKPSISAGNRSISPVPAVATDSPSSSQGLDSVVSAVAVSSADAVTVDISRSEVVSSGVAGSATPPVDPESSGKASAKLTDEQAQQLAEQYQAVLNQTSVRFGVTVEHGENKAISFQVIDRESGKVVRQFPAEKMGEVTAKAAGGMDKGKLVDETT